MDGAGVPGFIRRTRFRRHPGAGQQIGGGNAQYRQGGGRDAIFVGAGGVHRGAQQREVHGVPADSAPQPGGGFGLSEDAEPAGDLACPHQPHHPLILVVPGQSDQLRDAGRSRNLGQPQSQAEPAKRSGQGLHRRDGRPHTMTIRSLVECQLRLRVVRVPSSGGLMIVGRANSLRGLRC